MFRLGLSLVLIGSVALASCGGERAEAERSEAEESSERASAVVASYDPSTITPAMVALGDSIFHGKIGASSCQACHGVGGQNGAAAPNLTDKEWLHSDGSWEAIAKTIKSGVMSPKQFSSVMQPYGGVMLSDDKLRAVSAYVYRLGHPAE